MYLEERPTARPTAPPREERERRKSGGRWREERMRKNEWGRMGEGERERGMGGGRESYREREGGPSTDHPDMNSFKEKQEVNLSMSLFLTVLKFHP